MQCENTKYPVIFPRISTDLFGYVSPWVVFQAVNEYLSKEMDLDGVGIVRMLEELGATWMLGQMVIECSSPIRSSVPLELNYAPRKTCGICSVRQTFVQSGEREVARYTEKFLAVSFAQRKSLPLSAVDHLWKRPGGEPAEDFGWVRLPENMELAEQLTVRHWWCDPNGHMTTYQYLNLVCELAGYWAGPPRILERLQIDFRAEFMPGERLSLYRGTENGIIYVSGIHEDGKLGFSSSVKLSDEEFPYARIRMDDLLKK